MVFCFVVLVISHKKSAEKFKDIKRFYLPSNYRLLDERNGLPLHPYLYSLRATEAIPTFNKQRFIGLSLQIMKIKTLNTLYKEVAT